MTELIAALDEIAMEHATKQFGEKGHVEHAWCSNDLEEKLAQFYFQCVRVSDESQLAHLARQLHSMLTVLFTEPKKEENQKVMVNLYRMIGQTRDVEGGKGEYTLAYMMIYEWSKFSMPLAEFALRMFVFDGNQDSGVAEPLGQGVARPLGSWKDIKYMCDYINTQVGSEYQALQHPLVQYAVQLIVEQFKQDEALYAETDEQNTQSISLLAKWIPREGHKTSRFAWLYPAISAAYFPEYMASAKACFANPKTSEEKRANVLDRAQKKCNAQFRVLVATLNRHLDTVQIKQCAGRWSEIDHHKTTSVTMQRQRKAFMNVTVKGDEKRSEDADRIECAENLSKYVMDRIKQCLEVKGGNLGLEQFTGDAYGLYTRRMQLNQRLNGESTQFYWNPYEYEDEDADKHAKNDYTSLTSEEILVSLEQEKQILNSQWRDNAAKKNGHALKNFIAMVDLSGSMKSPGMQPYYAAIALGCRVAEKSTLGKRVLAFASEPTWINLSDAETFTDMTEVLFKTTEGQGMSTNFYAALDVILAAIVEKKLNASAVQDMTLVIFSDMQIDSCLAYDRNDCPGKSWSTMCDVIKQKYHDIGLEMCGMPYQAPHILFWNLTSTTGFPTMSTEKNVSMLSGFDPSVLETFCEEGMAGLQEITPINMIYKVLANKRYDALESVLLETI